jgi:predicted membrane protein
MHEKTLARAYFRELGGSILVYVVILAAALSFGRAMDEGALRTLVLVSPMAGFCLMIWAVARHVRRIDEYIRQGVLETIAITMAVTAGLTFTYGFLENAGYPRLSMFTVWMVMGGVWVAVCAIRGVLKR